MSSEITAQERAAIEAAVAAGKITKVPTGTTSYAGWVWCEEKGQLVSTDPERISWRQQGTNRLRNIQKGQRLKALPAHKRPHPKVTDRREKVRAMAAEGMIGTEIANALGVPVTTIWSDAKAMGVEFGRRGIKDPEVEEKRREAYRLRVVEGIPPRHVAAQLGITTERVRKYVLQVRKSQEAA